MKLLALLALALLAAVLLRREAEAYDEPQLRWISGW